MGMTLPKPTGKPRGMNKWEQRFAAELDAQKACGLIEWWAYESVRLKLANGAWYKTDFFVMWNMENEDFHVSMLKPTCYEIKGYMREAANVRIKVAADKYRCFKFVIVKWSGGAWVYDEVQP